jgi:hypothetical protein
VNALEVGKMASTRQSEDKMLKLTYQAMFRELLLREELLAERENNFYEYQISGHELVEILLSEKERDKNLHKLQKEKYEQFCRGRHHSDLASENLAHQQSSLTALYETELIAVKKQLEEAEGKVIGLSNSLTVAKEELKGKHPLIEKQSLEIAALKDKLEKMQGENAELKALREQMETGAVQMKGLNSSLR